MLTPNIKTKRLKLRVILSCSFLLIVAISLFSLPISSYAVDPTTTTTTTISPTTTTFDDIDETIPNDTTVTTTPTKQKTVAQENAAKANSKLNKASQKLLAAQLAADTTSQEIQTMQTTLAELNDKIAKNEALIAIKELPLEQLHKVIKKRAVVLYQDSSGDSTDPIEKFLKERQSALSSSAQTSNVKELDEFTKQRKVLDDIENDLTKQQDEIESKKIDLEVLSKKLAEQLDAAKKEYEKTAGLFLDAHAVIGLRVAVDGKMCPIAGPISHVDDYGFPRSGGRSHKGNDIFNAYGTPNVAIVSGTIQQQNGGLGGQAVKLFGDDGYAYYYAHLSAYAGTNRRVTQGEVIGFTGDTGNAKGGVPHTHFEIKVNGINVNPYPIVRIICGA